MLKKNNNRKNSYSGLVNHLKIICTSKRKKIISYITVTFILRKKGIVVHWKRSVNSTIHYYAFLSNLTRSPSFSYIVKYFERDYQYLLQIKAEEFRKA